MTAEIFIRNIDANTITEDIRSWGRKQKSAADDDKRRDISIPSSHFTSTCLDG
jgi:hypothetical protein